LYFKTKDDLLNKLAYDLCDRFTHYVQHGYNETDSLFNRYRKMFENKLAFLRDNPTVATNLSQYQAMLGFNEIIERLIHDDDFIWNKFYINIHFMMIDFQFFFFYKRKLNF